MDHVEADNQGNVQPGLLNGQMLHPVELFHVELPQHRANLPLGNGSIRLFTSQPRYHDAGSLVHLAGLLFHRHLLQQGLGAAVRLLAGERYCLCSDNAGHSQQKAS